MASHSDAVDGRAPTADRAANVPSSERNPKQASCAAVPAANRIPDAVLTVCMIGGDTEVGGYLARGLANPSYAAAFNTVVLPASVLLPANRAGLTGILVGVHTVVLAVPRLRAVSQADEWNSLLESCKQADVKRFLPCPYGFDLAASRKVTGAVSSIGRWLEEQTALMTSGLDYIVVNSGVLTEHLFSPMAGVDVQNGILRPPGGPNVCVTTTTLDDLARLLPEILLSPSAQNSSIRVASDTISYRDIAALLQEITGRPVATEEVAEEVVVRRASQQPDDTAAVYSFIVQSGQGILWSKGDSWNARHVPHVRTTSVRQWAAQHITAAPPAVLVTAGPTFQPNLHPTAVGSATAAMPIVVAPMLLQPAR